MFCHAGPPPPGCAAGAPAAGASLAAGIAARAGAVGFGHACLLPGKGRDGMSLFRASSRGRARGAAGGRIAAARLARLIARARRQTHLARPFPPGVFSRPPAVAFCRKAERRPREPPLSTFILHHTAKCQAHPGTPDRRAGFLAARFRPSAGPSGHAGSSIWAAGESLTRQRSGAGGLFVMVGSSPARWARATPSGAVPGPPCRVELSRRGQPGADAGGGMARWIRRRAARRWAPAPPSTRVTRRP